MQFTHVGNHLLLYWIAPSVHVPGPTLKEVVTYPELRKKCIILTVCATGSIGETGHSSMLINPFLLVQLQPESNWVDEKETSIDHTDDGPIVILFVAKIQEDKWQIWSNWRWSTDVSLATTVRTPAMSLMQYKWVVNKGGSRDWQWRDIQKKIESDIQTIYIE